MYTGYKKDYGIAYLKEPSNNPVKVTASEFRGKIYIHIREYIVDGDTGAQYPTKNGYAITGDNLDLVISLLEKASYDLGKVFKDQKQLSLFNKEDKMFNE